ncbi:aminotransferase class I/II-fold pyridoxal phosphate-dependent enzyme [Chloroflexi bacterium TSY]|nr:aminotransferase class I/II-fold pyridoxal phosphate-dependent enzyme [Chloroflexi bacterium TSY]
MAIFPRATIRETPIAIHGAVQQAELADWNLPVEQVIDFSSNINPYGPAPAVHARLAEFVREPGSLERYPDPEAIELRQMLADRHCLSPKQIVIGNGSAELIWLTAFAYLSPGDPILIVGPTFGEYERTARLMGAQVVEWRALPEQEFAICVDSVKRILNEFRPLVVFLCNPNNPTGTYLPENVIAQWAQHHSQTIFFVDEAYIDFVADATSVVNSVKRHSLSRSKFGVFDYFQSGEKGFWGHFFRSQLPKTANFISRNRLNFT